MLRLYEIPIQEKIFPYIPCILLSLVTLIIIYILYFKSKNKFWLNQDIYNKYDPLSWTKKGVIKEKVEITKYFNTLCYSSKWKDLETKKKELLIILLNKNYNYYKNLDIQLGVKNVESLFVKHNDCSYITLNYKNPKQKDKIISSIISKPIEGRFNNEKLNIYFFDYMCYNKEEKIDAFFETLYTHYKRHRDSNLVKYFLFRTSDKIEITTSLVSYASNLVSTKFFPQKIYSHCKNVKFEIINSSNYRLFLEMFYSLYEVFECFLHVNIAQLLYLIDEGYLYITVILLHNKPLACYFFKQTFSLYNKNPCMSLIGSYQNKVNDELFLEGFYNSIILINERSKFNNIIIESLSNNIKILKDVKKYKIMETFISHYYLYNFIHKSFNSNQVLFLL